MNETMTKPEIRLTDAALARMREQCREAGRAGIRLSVAPAGCSGLKYVMDFADGPEEGDLVLAFDGFSLFVDGESHARALKGLVVDFQRDPLSSGFVFLNPNKKGECGCGESFTV